MGTEIIEIEDLSPKAGDSVEEWINNYMIPFLNQRDIIDLGPNAFATVGPEGTSIDYRQPPGYRGKFIVTTEGFHGRVSPGLFNEEFEPTINGQYLDGRYQSDTSKQGDAPTFAVLPPNGSEFTYVCLVVKTDANSGEPLFDDEDWLTIEYIVFLDEARRERGPAEGFKALARIRWDENGNVAKVTQIANHDVTHYFVEGEGSRPGFHFFDGQ
ncbi:MAG: hypothetical protein ACTSU8_02140 [Alphaproteobacteria bacterium]